MRKGERDGVREGETKQKTGCVGSEEGREGWSEKRRERGKEGEKERQNK